MADEKPAGIWMNQEAFDKLSAELQYLKTEGRAKVAAKIAQARDEGDLSENAGYHAARDDQGHQEARIRQLTAMLRDAHIGEPPTESDEVAPGLAITICFDGDEDDTDTFVLGSRELLGLDTARDIEVYSPQSPLGAAVLGKRVGDTVSYPAPNGTPIEVTVLAVEPLA